MKTCSPGSFDGGEVRRPWARPGPHLLSPQETPLRYSLADGSGAGTGKQDAARGGWQVGAGQGHPRESLGRRTDCGRGAG